MCNKNISIFTFTGTKHELRFLMFLLYETKILMVFTKKSKFSFYFLVFMLYMSGSDSEENRSRENINHFTSD